MFGVVCRVLCVVLRGVLRVECCVLWLGMAVSLCDFFWRNALRCVVFNRFASGLLWVLCRFAL